MNPIIGMLHNTATGRYHWIIFLARPLPGPGELDKPSVSAKWTRYKSHSHHTDGFATREQALTYVREELAPIVQGGFGLEPRLCLEKSFAWDGQDVPAMVVFFAKTPEGIQPSF